MQWFQLLVYPDCPSSWINVDRWPDTEAKKESLNVFQMLDALGSMNEDMKSVGAEVQDGSLPFLRFDEAAQGRFDTWREELERRLRSEDAPVMEAHLAKYRSLIPSLALLIHLAEDPTGPVPLDALERAIRWGTYLESHARRVYSPAIHRDIPAAHALVKKLKDGSLSGQFAARDVYRKQWSGLKTAEDVEAAASLLIKWNYLRDHEAQTGGRPQTVYSINPAVTATTVVRR